MGLLSLGTDRSSQSVCRVTPDFSLDVPCALALSVRAYRDSCALSCSREYGFNRIGVSADKVCNAGPVRHAIAGQRLEDNVIFVLQLVNCFCTELTCALL